jgi:hypothetical protein
MTPTVPKVIERTYPRTLESELDDLLGAPFDLKVVDAVRCTSCEFSVFEPYDGYECPDCGKSLEPAEAILENEPSDEWLTKVLDRLRPFGIKRVWWQDGELNLSSRLTEAKPPEL